MKTLLLVTGGRGGSDFFQGLLDGHSQILHFPCYLSIDKDFKDMISLDTPDKISKDLLIYIHIILILELVTEDLRGIIV